MADILMVYGTKEGYTRKIVDYLAEVARAEGHNVKEAPVETIDASDPLEADGILLAASVHLGQHSEVVRRFVLDHLARLGSGVSAFLSVSMSAANPKRKDVADGYVQTFLTDTGWMPTVKGVCGGALKYTRYGLIMRMIMKRIARQEGMPIDTKRDYEFADWDQMHAYAREFCHLVEDAVALEVEAGCG